MCRGLGALVAFKELASKITFNGFVDQVYCNATFSCITVCDEFSFQRTGSSTSCNAIAKDHFASHRVDGSCNSLARSPFTAIVNGKHIFAFECNTSKRGFFRDRTAALAHERVQHGKLVRAIAVGSDVLRSFVTEAREFAVHA